MSCLSCLLGLVWSWLLFWLLFMLAVVLLVVLLPFLLLWRWWTPEESTIFGALWTYSILLLFLLWPNSLWLEFFSSFSWLLLWLFSLLLLVSWFLLLLLLLLSLLCFFFSFFSAFSVFIMSNNRFNWIASSSPSNFTLLRNFFLNVLSGFAFFFAFSPRRTG